MKRIILLLSLVVFPAMLRAANPAFSHLVWTNAGGIPHLATNAPTLGLGDTNTFITRNAGGASLEEERNLGFGYQTGNKYTSGSRNSMFGNLSGASLGIGSLNSGFGFNSLNAATDGANNSGFGARTLQFCVGGSQNTAVGLEALQHVVSGTDNCALGYDAADAATGDFICAFGSESLHNLGGGRRHSAFGWRSGFNCQATGGFNTFLGAQADHSAFPGLETNSTAVGFFAKITANNQVVLGNTAVTEVTTTGSVTSSGATNNLALHVVGTANFRSNAVVSAGQGAASNAWIGGRYYQSIGGLFTNLNAAGTMSNLANVSVTGNTLTNNGDTIWGEWGIKLANTKVSSNQFQIVYGSSTPFDTGMQSSSNVSLRILCQISRTGNTSQHFEAWVYAPGIISVLVTNVNVELAETNGIATTLALKGGSSALGSHTNNSFVAKWEPGVR